QGKVVDVTWQVPQNKDRFCCVFIEVHLFNHGAGGRPRSFCLECKDAPISVLTGRREIESLLVAA
ncbi:MAG: hypothetical protein VB857_13190, partial [Pirellulaceae bacterium]